MNLFKVFPRFGLMILGEPAGTPPSWPAHAIGWAYHFSNGATFGVMYVALLGEAARRAWGWGVLWAVGLELGMLLTPYPAVFGIHVATAFVVVTLLAHLVFGAVLGLLARRMARLWPTAGPAEPGPSGRSGPLDRHSPGAVPAGTHGGVSRRPVPGRLV